MPQRVTRLDAELVKRGLARSREHARGLIEAGVVEVRGVVVHKPASGVAADTAVRIVQSDDEPTWASRGGVKLAGALERFATLPVAGRRCLDAGASTGGFTDVLLSAGASAVVAVDVGYGQLAWRLRTDERVTVHDRTNVRTLGPADIGGPVELTVADLSFISLPLVLPALTACTTTDLVPMVKPQFEVGRERLGAGGVVRDRQHRIEAVIKVARAAADLGWDMRDVVASSLPGPAGNVEFFLWLHRSSPTETETETETGSGSADAFRTVDEAAVERAVMEAG
ncbi:MAG: TlyA family RNA methyltransferase [Actinobacteria bacterium]|nr:TlyA family RNA methyltransferase [Actinomycetota bacterium]